MIGVVPRQRANAEGAEEFVFVEHLREHAAKPGLVQDRSEVTARDTGLVRVMDGRVEFWPGCRGTARNRSRVSGFLREQLARRTSWQRTEGSSPTMDRTLSRCAWPLGSRSTS